MSKASEQSEDKPFTIEQFYKFIAEKKLMAAKCGRCGSMLVPPRPVCPNCYSRELRWEELKNRGRLLTYTVIHIAPRQFQSAAPYVYGIVELEHGLRLPGMIKTTEHGKVAIGMELEVDFDTQVSPEWPQWPRYFFRPL